MDKHQLISELQLSADLPQDLDGSFKAGLVLCQQLPHAHLRFVGTGLELGLGDLSKRLNVLDEHPLEENFESLVQASKAFGIGQNLQVNEKFSLFSKKKKKKSLLPSPIDYSHHRSSLPRASWWEWSCSAFRPRQSP